MIKQKLQNDQLHVSIEKMDFSYRIPVAKLGKTGKWVIGDKDVAPIEMTNVSMWTLKLFSKNPLAVKHVKEFQSIVQEHAPGNSIDWKNTLLAVDIQTAYNRLKERSTSGSLELGEDEIIASVADKFGV